MAVTANWYGLGLKAFMDGSINYASDTIKVALATVAYTPNQDTDQFFSSVTEATGTGYTAGGVTLASKTSTYVTGTNTVDLDAADVSWPTVTTTFHYAIIYKSTGTNSTSPLLGYVNFGADESPSAGPINITWDAAGILNVSAA